MKSTLWNCFFGFFILGLGGTLYGGDVAVAETPSALPFNGMDMVWAEKDGLRHEVFYSSWDGENWSDPIRVTNDDSDNVAPCIDAATDGKKHLVWMSVDVTGHRVKHAAFDGAKWSDSQQIPSLPAVSGAPFVAIGENDEVWVVFSGNNGEDDDIFTTRLVDGEWTNYQQVNADNESPDIHPFVEVDNDNKVRITWQGYRESGYVTLQSMWREGKWQPETVVSAQDKEAESAPEWSQGGKAGMTLPDFVDEGSQVFIRTRHR